MTLVSQGIVVTSEDGSKSLPTGGEENTMPAISVVPVVSMSMLDISSSTSNTNVRDGLFMAIQATLMEPTALETVL